jgi:seryl-tRNA synthetase
MLQENETNMLDYVKNNSEDLVRNLSNGHYPTILNGFYYIQFQQLAKENKRLDTKISELHAENKELLSKFNEILTAITVKKTDDEEIAELQARIQIIYDKKRSL